MLIIGINPENIVWIEITCLKQDTDRQKIQELFARERQWRNI